MDDRIILLELIDELVSGKDDCWFDHSGNCQEHLWFREDPPCPVGRAKKLLASGMYSDIYTPYSEGES